MPRLGVVGSMVWDEIHGKGIHTVPVEEWGGIAYALSALDAALPNDWEIVPLVKVGRDLASEAATFLRSITHCPASARFIEVPAQNQRVILRYDSVERRTEQMSGGVPPWTWAELGPMIRDLDALYVNFISGHELTLETAQLLRQGFSGPIYADLHSLALDTTAEGIRVLQDLPDAVAWCASFDYVQCNEDEFGRLGSEAPTVIANTLAAGVSLLIVTLGSRGAAYFARQGFHHVHQTHTSATHDDSPVVTELTVPPVVSAVDPTGCGDVFGATCFARLLAGDDLKTALTVANVAGARTATFHGATRLADFLRGQLVLV